MIAGLAARLVAEARAHRHRRVLVLAGEPAWCRAAAAEAVGAASAVLWLGRAEDAHAAAQVIEPERARAALGQEVEAAVLDFHAGLDPDALGATAGTVRGGGLLVLLTPPLEGWAARGDPGHARLVVEPYVLSDIGGRFLRRFVRILGETPGVAIAHEDGRVEVRAAPAGVPVAASGDDVCRTRQQRVAVALVIRAAIARTHRPIVLVADRGRGKSAALGIASARLMRKRPRRIVITAPALAAVQPVFEHARRLLGLPPSKAGALEHAGSRLVYLPPGDLLDLLPPADLLLVDEAAALPVPLLATLLDRYPRIVFATTTHGYEGTGRGFALRFQAMLDEHDWDWRRLRLEEPVRWAPGDPVEQFCFRALLLDAEPAPDEAVEGAAPETVRVAVLDRDALAADEATLAALFGLLVIAHYRTTPTDLQRLLDAPNIEVLALRHGPHVVGAALVSTEGGFAAPLAAEIRAGRRRPRGHLLPETLAYHSGFAEAATLRCARVVRIAVHPAVQGRGLGSLLLEAAAGRAIVAGLDLIGSAFGATEDLLRFWTRHGFDPVRVGVTRGKSSGEHAAVVLRPLSPAGAGLFEASRARFHRELPHLLGDPLRHLEPALAAALLVRPDPPPFDLDAHDWQDLAEHVHGPRIYDLAVGPVWRFTLGALARVGEDFPGRDLLIAKVVQKQSWDEVQRRFGFSGRGPALKALRQALCPLVERFAPTL